jgi:hypothetical protein
LITCIRVAALKQHRATNELWVSRLFFGPCLCCAPLPPQFGPTSGSCGTTPATKAVTCYTHDKSSMRSCLMARCRPFPSLCSATESLKSETSLLSMEWPTQSTAG